jgi:hypothetical protein
LFDVASFPVPELFMIRLQGKRDYLKWTTIANTHKFAKTLPSRFRREDAPELTDRTLQSWEIIAPPLK